MRDPSRTLIGCPALPVAEGVTWALATSGGKGSRTSPDDRVRRCSASSTPLLSNVTLKSTLQVYAGQERFQVNNAFTAKINIHFHVCMA